MINPTVTHHSSTLKSKTVSAATVAETVPVIASRDLLSGSPCVFIEHGGALYALRATRNGKLILTK